MRMPPNDPSVKKPLNFSPPVNPIPGANEGEPSTPTSVSAKIAIFSNGAIEKDLSQRKIVYPEKNNKEKLWDSLKKAIESPEGCDFDFLLGKCQRLNLFSDKAVESELSELVPQILVKMNKLATSQGVKERESKIGVSRVLASILKQPNIKFDNAVAEIYISMLSILAVENIRKYSNITGKENLEWLKNLICHPNFHQSLQLDITQQLVLLDALLDFDDLPFDFWLNVLTNYPAGIFLSMKLDQAENSKIIDQDFRKIISIMSSIGNLSNGINVFEIKINGKYLIDLVMENKEEFPCFYEEFMSGKQDIYLLLNAKNRVDILNKYPQILNHFSISNDIIISLFEDSENSPGIYFLLKSILLRVDIRNVETIYCIFDLNLQRNNRILLNRLFSVPSDIFLQVLHIHYSKYGNSVLLEMPRDRLLNLLCHVKLEDLAAFKSENGKVFGLNLIDYFLKRVGLKPQVSLEYLMSKKVDDIPLITSKVYKERAEKVKKEVFSLWNSINFVTPNQYKKVKDEDKNNCARLSELTYLSSDGEETLTPTPEQVREYLDEMLDKIIAQEATLGTPSEVYPEKLHRFYTAILLDVEEIVKILARGKINQEDKKEILITQEAMADTLARCVDSFLKGVCRAKFFDDTRGALGSLGQSVQKETDPTIEEKARNILNFAIDTEIENLVITNREGDVHDLNQFRYAAGLSPISDFLSENQRETEAEEAKRWAIMLQTEMNSSNLGQYAVDNITLDDSIEGLRNKSQIYSKLHETLPRFDEDQLGSAPVNMMLGNLHEMWINKEDALSKTLSKSLKDQKVSPEIDKKIQNILPKLIFTQNPAFEELRSRIVKSDPQLNEFFKDKSMSKSFYSAFAAVPTEDLMTISNDTIKGIQGITKAMGENKKIEYNFSGVPPWTKDNQKERLAERTRLLSQVIPGVRKIDEDLLSPLLMDKNAVQIKKIIEAILVYREGIRNLKTETNRLSLRGGKITVAFDPSVHRLPSGAIELARREFYYSSLLIPEPPKKLTEEEKTLLLLDFLEKKGMITLS